MNKVPTVPAIHHITAITSNAADNLRFYNRTLGMRLVKKTVNFDDPTTYHLYYGDREGSPGTILTFFPWESLSQGTLGAGMVTAVAFAVAVGSLDFWFERLSSEGIAVEVMSRFGDPVLCFSDPAGLPLELIGCSELPGEYSWKEGPVNSKQAIHGFHSATVTLHTLAEEQNFLTNLLGMELRGREENRFRFKMAEENAPGLYLDLLIDPEAPEGVGGSGTVHHIAFRAANDRVQTMWRSRLKNAGMEVTQVRDRNYFKSIYFRTPGKILGEIATDPPGFAVDEPVDQLGRYLKLPDQYEHFRDRIVPELPLLQAAPHHYLFVPSQDERKDDHTIVALHGTGGNERDMINLACSLFPSSAVLSPRGTVLENGMLRFFKRLAVNRFDEEDVIRRADALADFISEKVGLYHRRFDRVTAMGYSNGANIAAAILILHPEIFCNVVLLRPMLPFGEPPIPDLTGKQVLIVQGSYDLVIPQESTRRLIYLLEKAGADVQVYETDSGHELTGHDLEVVTQWRNQVKNCQKSLFC